MSAKEERLEELFTTFLCKKTNKKALPASDKRGEKRLEEVEHEQALKDEEVSNDSQQWTLKQKAPSKWFHVDPAREHTPTIPTSAVRNTGGRSGPQGLEEPTSDEVLRELCDKTTTNCCRSSLKKCKKKKSSKISSTQRQPPGQSREGSMEVSTPEAHHQLPVSSEDSDETNLLHRGPGRGRKVVYSESGDSEGGHWKSKSKRHWSNTYEVDLSQPWTCEERNPFTPRIRHFDFLRTMMPSHVKTYDSSGDLEDHLKLFQSVAKIERWTMPTWCHMFNSTLTGNARVWYDKLPKESIDSYEDLRAAFRENDLQQTKHIKDPVEIHHIKQRNGESTKDFMERYKAEVLDVEGAPECMKISGFMHGITHPELIKRLYKKISRSMDEMYRVTMSFLQGEVAAFSYSRKKAPAPWRQPEEGNKPNFKKGLKTSKGRIGSQIGEEDGTEGPMIIEAEIGGHFVHRIYVDGGASSEVLYEHCFVRLRPEIRSQMIPATTSLIGFSRETIWPIGQISLLVKIGDEEHSTSAWMNFMVIRSPSQHNGIIGRTGIRKICVVPSTAHGMLKFPVKGGTVTIRSSRVIPMECAMISGPNTQHPVTSQVLEEKIKVAIHPEYPEQTIAIGSTLTEKGRKELCALLRQNLDVFAWKPADMTGVPRHIAEHRLNVREGCLPIRQKKRGQAPERNKAIQEEVEKLVDAGIMKEVHYHSWLSNPVMVKKHDGSWRMCVDFKDLNKACPQDGYPLPEIDWKVESLCGYPLKCFLDAYKGYHQIKMAEEDEEKTAFITSQGIFCYTKMPFGLKNAGATYQRLVDRAFQKQIGRNLEVYVDDLVIKSHTEEEIIRDIAETFKTLRQINMKLNPKKCTFGMQEGMFLGYKVNADGLKVCPDKADAVLSLPSPGCLKDVQKLNGKLASLNRFLSKSAEKSLPFFKTLKKCTKKSDFQWTQEAEIAFRQMKKLIADLPMLTAPKEREELIIYLAAAKEAISAVLMTEREGKQMPVYFVSRALRGPEINYTPMEKLVLALLSASRRLKRYFQAHTIVVITDQPIKQLLSNSEITRRMLKWKFELEGYDIQYRPRISIKGQILADFIVERPDEPMTEPEELPEPWTLFTDGSSCIDGSGAGLILTNPEGVEFTYAMRFRFEVTNNKAEYEALIAGLVRAEESKKPSLS
ncbi:reverse transcriptase domain-containing protein [Tanacetum coccineum]